MDWKGSIKNIIPGFGAIDTAKDFIEPRIGLNPAQRGSSGRANQIIDPNIDINKRVTIGDTIYDGAGNPVGKTGGGTTLAARSGNYSAGAGGGGGGPTPQEIADRNAALYQIDAGIGSSNEALGRLGRQQDIGFGNINRDFQDAWGRLVGQKKIAQSDYTNNKVDQLNQYQSARNNVASGARGWMDSAQRTLGSQGAGGGSAARYAVPQEAQLMATRGNTEAQGTNNRNIMSLDQNWRRAEDEFGNSQQDLQRQKTQGENDFRSRIEQQRAELLNTIGTLTGQRVLANDGSYQQAMAASQPYTSRIKGILDSIDGLAATPAIRERKVTVGRPDLSGYNFARPEAPAAPVQDPTLSGNPILAALFGQPQEEQQYV